MLSSIYTTEVLNQLHRVEFELHVLPNLVQGDVFGTTLVKTLLYVFSKETTKQKETALALHSVLEPEFHLQLSIFCTEIYHDFPSAAKVVFK